jgi:multicomponent Na+:H+ antiporter subunit A
MMTVLLACFAAAIAAPWVQKAFPGRATALLAIVPLLTALWLGRELFGAAPALRWTWPWMPSLDLSLSLRADALSLIFGVLVAGIGAIIVVYAGAYLKGHPHLGRFLLYLFAFMASMLGLVLADHVLVLFVFWELTSLWSYLLIGFHHEREQARAAALRALVVTELGGLALLAGLVLLAQAGGSWELSVLAERGERLREDPRCGLLTVLLLAGAFTKSAQVPFHFWLPDAMEAPTPASAYLHAATMVKAGIYLIFRLAGPLGGTELWQGALLAAGAATALLGSWLAVRQSDLKRLLAYSTVASLGSMVFLLGIGSPEAVTAALVVLVAHAFYKGAFFLVAGAVDHETGERNLDRLGGLARKMPMLALGAGLAGLSMIGLPPTAGYLGKEAALQAAGSSLGRPTLWTSLSVGVNALLIAASLRLALGPFAGPLRHTPRAPHEAPWGLRSGPLILGLGGLALGVATPPFDRVIARATESVLGQPGTVHLSLWHGWTPALLLSAITLAAGLGVYGLRDRLRGGAAIGARLAEWGPGRMFGSALAGLNAAAKGLTGMLQNGSLPAYGRWTVAAAILPGLVLLSRASFAAVRGPDLKQVEALVAILVAAAALAAVRLKSMLGAVVSMGAAGYGVALLFALYGAPDLAMTQFVVESLAILLFVFVFRHLPRQPERAAPSLLDRILPVSCGALMAGLLWALPEAPSAKPVSAFYAEASLPHGHGRNVVNVILVDFRGVDTLGEISVLLTAAVGTFALLRLRPGRRPGP